MEAQQKTIADQKLKDLKVKNYLFQAIDRTIKETILNKVPVPQKLKELNSKLLGKRLKSEGESVDAYFIRCLRIDKGGEFTSHEFNNFCKINDISRQLTAAYTPQQNDVAERKNRKIMNMVRSILSEKQIVKNFLPKSVN